MSSASPAAAVEAPSTGDVEDEPQQSPGALLHQTAILRIPEPHGEPIYACSFNHVDTTQASVFATVGGGQVNIYRVDPPPLAEGAASNNGTAEDGGAAAVCSSAPDTVCSSAPDAVNGKHPKPRGGRGKASKRKRGGGGGGGGGGGVVGALVALQTYVDGDPRERFYTCDWGVACDRRVPREL